MKILFPIIVLCFLFPTISSAQYTSSINSNKPGNTQTPFAVGTNVYQVENTISFEDLTNQGQKNQSIKNDLSLRFGFWKEELEASLIHKFRDNISQSTLGTEVLAIGAKYLVFKPKPKKDELLTLSWKRRNQFRIYDLIPYVAVSAHYNLPLTSGNFRNDTGSSFSTAVITQNRITRKINVNNQFEFNYIGSDLPEFVYSVSVSHVYKKRFNPFIELQYHNDKRLAYFNLGIGTPFLVNRDLSIAAQYNYNFGLNYGGSEIGINASYRIDKHYDKWIYKKLKKKKKRNGKELKKQNKKEFLDEISEDPKKSERAKRRALRKAKREAKRAQKEADNQDNDLYDEFKDELGEETDTLDNLNDEGLEDDKATIKQRREEEKTRLKAAKKAAKRERKRKKREEVNQYIESQFGEEDDAEEFVNDISEENSYETPEKEEPEFDAKAQRKAEKEALNAEKARLKAAKREKKRKQREEADRFIENQFGEEEVSNETNLEKFEEEDEEPEFDYKAQRKAEKARLKAERKAEKARIKAEREEWKREAKEEAKRLKEQKENPSFIEDYWKDNQ